MQQKKLKIQTTIQTDKHNRQTKDNKYSHTLTNVYNSDNIHHYMVR